MHHAIFCNDNFDRLDITSEKSNIRIDIGKYLESFIIGKKRVFVKLKYSFQTSILLSHQTSTKLFLYNNRINTRLEIIKRLSNNVSNERQQLAPQAKTFGQKLG